MRSVTAFVRAFARADKATFRSALTRIHAQLSAMEDGEDLPEDPEVFLYDLADALRGVDPSCEPAGLRAVIDGAFADLESAEADDIDLLLHRIHHILTGRVAFDRPPWCYHVLGSPSDDYNGRKPCRARAMQLQRAFRLPCQGATTRDDLLHSRGILLEAPATARELMLVGAALERGCVVVALGEIPDLPDIPSFETPEEAFQGLVDASRARFAEVPGPDFESGDWSLRQPLSAAADRSALQLRCEILEQSYAALLSAATGASDRHAARSAEIDLLMRGDDVPEHVRKGYFEIVANGSRSGHSPVAAQKINGMRFRIEALEKEIEDLQGHGDPSP